MKMIENNIHIINERITESCKKCGRNPNEITLIAVSKYNYPVRISEAIKSGIINFGENKAQEFQAKSKAITEKIVWHFIGHLQTNKVKYVIEKADYIHSVDSVKIAREIDKKAKAIDKVQNILLEIKTSDEESKFGLGSFEDILKIAEFSKNAGNLNLKGLMTMAPFTDNEFEIRKSFKRLKELQEKLVLEGFGVEHLSMGMTSDFEIAIEEGATMIRIGTAIFGERDYSFDWRKI